MRKIGVIGGLSWVSTAAYYRLLNETTQARLGGVHSARLVIESVDRQRYVDLVRDQGDEAGAAAMILDAARAVQAAGADFIVIACNDVHRFVPTLAPELLIPFLHIAETTAVEIARAGLRRVALLGVAQTMEGDFYPDILARHGIDTMIPVADARAFIDASIMNEMVRGRFTARTRARYVALIEDLHAAGAEGIVLGCTEIPLLLSADDTGVPLFPTTDIHCRAAVARAISD